MIHLLSPVSHTVQVTQDFWNNTYVEVKKELSSSYF